MEEAKFEDLEEFQVEKTNGSWISWKVWSGTDLEKVRILDRLGVEKSDILFVEGLCAANPSGLQQRRDRRWYLENVLEPLIRAGKVSDGSTGSFDDRKFWYDCTSVIESKEGNTALLVALGISYYQAFRADLDKTTEEYRRLHQIGLDNFGNKYACLATRLPGIAVLPITADGSIFIGERTNQECRGLLNAVAGHLTYKENVGEVSLEENASREMKEEFGIEPESLENLRFVGVYSHPLRGDLDFTFLVNVDKGDSYFASEEWMKSVKEREHKPLVKLSTFAEVNELLKEGRLPTSDRKYQLMYSTRGALMSLKSGEIKG